MKAAENTAACLIRHGPAVTGRVNFNRGFGSLPQPPFQSTVDGEAKGLCAAWATWSGVLLRQSETPARISVHLKIQASGFMSRL
jgi:hypothetical protein